MCLYLTNHNNKLCAYIYTVHSYIYCQRSRRVGWWQQCSTLMVLYNVIFNHITSSFTCTTRNLIYAIVCQRCQMLYRILAKPKHLCPYTRFWDHIRSIRSVSLSFPGRPIATHFNSNSHTIEHTKITSIL